MAFKRAPLVLICTVSWIALPAAAYAQDTAGTGPTPQAQTETPANNGGIEDIVVTADRSARGQTSQRVPVAVTAVSGDMISSMHANTLIDVAQIAPSVNFTGAATLPGFANFFIRGIGVSGSTSSIDPAVNVLVDGMVYDFQGGTILDSFDVESVEILRGPQGILFGRNTTGGVVSVNTRRPTDHFEGRAEITVGNYNRYDASVMLSGPLVGDSLLGKVAVLYRNRDGFVRDRNGGTFVPAPFNPSGIQPDNPTGTLGDMESLTIRPSLTWRPADNIDVNLLGEYVHMNGGGSASRIRKDYATFLTDRFGYTPPAGILWPM